MVQPAVSAISYALNRVSVFFPVPMSGLTTTTNFTIAGLTVTVAASADDGKRADLTTTGMVTGDPYTLVVDPKLQVTTPSDVAALGLRHVNTTEYDFFLPTLTLDPLTDHTLSMWFRRDNTTGSKDGYVFEDDAAAWNFVPDLGVQNMRFSHLVSSVPTDIDVGYPLVVGKWYQVVVAYEGDAVAANRRVRLYVDGVEIADDVTDGPGGGMIWFAGSDGVLAPPGAPRNHYDGRLDEIAFWDSALTDVQVAQLYEEGRTSNVFSPAPDHYWPMDFLISAGLETPDVVGSEDMTTINVLTVDDARDTQLNGTNTFDFLGNTPPGFGSGEDETIGDGFQTSNPVSDLTLVFDGGSVVDVIEEIREQPIAVSVVLTQANQILSVSLDDSDQPLSASLADDATQLSITLQE